MLGVEVQFGPQGAAGLVESPSATKRVGQWLEAPGLLPLCFCHLTRAEPAR